MWTFKENKKYERESENRPSTPISKNRRLVNGRIDYFYKSTKMIQKDDNSSKRDVSNRPETPSRNRDPKNKQETLSPWLIKENKSGFFDKKTSYRRRRRKPSTPKRSARTRDPDFRGATVWFNRGSEDDNQLVITSSFSNTRQQRETKSKKKRQFLSLMEPKSSSENDESVEITQLPVSNGKMCASCNTTVTPLWRDAEDGTPLCNACGIRYRKYRIRCCYCWHIPKKDCKAYQICPLCGSDLKFSCYRKI